MFKAVKNTVKKYIALILFLLAMFAIHKFVFLYADDFYYCRDASAGLSNLPHFIIGELNANGRLWVHLLLLGIVKYNVYLFRIVNPIVITLIALLIAKISIGLDYARRDFIIATACACMIFLFLPVEIANTSIYYAADTLNYLYAPGATMLYAYLLYRDYILDRNEHGTKWSIVLAAFFAGSSTQQAGMIAIGFSILIPLYFKIFKKVKYRSSLLPYYISLFAGYSVVTYGSIKRMFSEENMGNSMNLKATISALLKTNIFSIPISGYVLALCTCSIFWLYHFYRRDNKKNKINLFALCVLSAAAIGYIYVVLYKKYNMVIFASDSPNTKLRLCFIAFTAAYLLIVFYVSLLLLYKENSPFFCFCCINAFGAQIMLIVVDPRFADSYRCMFPSLLLMSIFIVYSFVKFYNNRLFLLSFLLSFSLAFYYEYYKKLKTAKNMPLNLSFSKACIVFCIFILIVLLILFILHKTLFKHMQFSAAAIFAVIVILSLCFWGVNYMGYKAASYSQAYNLNAIKKYHESSDKSVLKLKEVPKTIYGYNVGNWNDMPYFMKECYKINEKTIIQYFK